MGDVVKWTLLVVGALAFLALILNLPFVQFINPGEFVGALTNIVTVCSQAFTFARGLINNFFLPFGRTVITGLMIWLFGKWALQISIKIGAWIYHFIFK